MLTDAMAYFSIELQRLDLLLHREILRLRASYQLSLDEFRGLYISDEQVNSLIDQALGHKGPDSILDELTQHAEALRANNAHKFDADLPWHCLAAEFQLSPIEQDVLLLAVAPELEIKYETLYAYLNNDVTRKWPTCDLALRLLATDVTPQLAVRCCLLPQSTLFGQGLLNVIQPTPARPVWRASGFSLAPSVAHYVLGLPTLPDSLTTFVTLHMPQANWDSVPLSAELRAALRRVPALLQPDASARSVPVLIFTGRYGTGRSAAAEAICHELEIPLLRVDLEAARMCLEPLHKLGQTLALQQRLHQAGVYLERVEALFDKEGKPLPDSSSFIKSLAQSCSPVFCICAPDTQWRELCQGQRTVYLHFDTPDYTTRLEVWEQSLGQAGHAMPAVALHALADRFAFTPGQITDAVTAALDTHHLLAEKTAVGLSEPALFEAARAQSGHSLGHLALKVQTLQTWDDLILSPATLRQVHEVAGAIQYRHLVYAEWGFEHRLASGKGLKVLFSGASGTGKTMTAGVIARDLGLDLYKIDLSSVVSKYIGETEKNLDRIFRAAQSSNAILFFDEADALFGKRSEVKDAHDRYANIEVAYLLQKLEEHDGAVILASNLSKNIDEAFSRRMHYVVEFPLPDEQLRERLWRNIFPPQAPLGEDVNLPFLAKQFSIAGGDIRNVALDAAFLAAQDGKVVTMKQLVKAVARQMMKQGRVPSPADFKQYHALIGDQS